MTFDNINALFNIKQSMFYFYSI